MFKKGPFDFNHFHHQNNAQNVYDAEFKENESKEPKKTNKPANLRKGLKIIPIFFAAVFLAFSLLQSVYSLEEDEYAVIQTWGFVQVQETPGIKFKIPYIQKIHKVS